jgi:rhamnosyl/mannosyltransferase
MTMKVVHVYKDFDPPIHGGMERHIALLCHYQKQWCEVEALVCSRSLRTRHMIHDDVPITLVGELGRFQSAPASPLFPLYMRCCKADVMVVHVPNPTAELGWLMTRPKAALVVRYQSDVVRQAAAMRFYRPFQEHFLSHADLILPTSQQYIDSSTMLKQFETKCRVAPLGIIAGDYDSPDPELVAKLRERYGHPFVFFCGVHRYYKGLPWLVRAAAHINAPVVIAGDGPERANIMSLAAELNLDITFPGALSHAELTAHLHACAVFAFPSVERSEAFGLSMLEAHACGKPVVATRLGTGVEFVNEDGKTGLNVPPKDAKAFAEAVNRLLADEALRTEMGNYARDRVRSQFDAETVARQEFDLYREALG